MSSALITLPPDTIDSLKELVGSDRMNMALTVLLVYEWLITLDVEIQLVWLRSGWNHMKIAYLLNRYLIIADVITLHLRSHGVHLDTCKPLLQAGGTFYIFGVFISEYILALRVCAVWKMNKILIAILVLINTTALIYDLVSYHQMLSSLVFFTVLPFGGCLTNVEGPAKLWISFMILAGYDTVILGLMVYPTIKGYTSPYQRTELVKRIHVEGVLFYIYLLVVDVITVIIEMVASNNVFLFVMVARFLRAILASRVVLHIREYSSPPLNGTVLNRTQISELRFE